MQKTKEQISLLEKEYEKSQTGIMKYMQDNEILSLNGSKLATWKNISRKTLSIEDLKKTSPSIYEEYLVEKTSRVFRLVT